MALVSFSDNVFTPGVTSSDLAPDQLVAVGSPITDPIVLMAGTLSRGAVLGQVAGAAPVIASAAASNAGNGAVTNISAGAAEVGSYTLTATSATTFSVSDPEGNALGTATVGTPFTGAEISVTITAGSASFAAGDAITLSSVDAVGCYVISVATANDGSQNPSAILSDAADASAGPVLAGAFLAGEFNSDGLAMDPSWNIPLLTSALRQGMMIYVKTPSAGLSAADPA